MSCPTIITKAFWGCGVTEGLPFPIFPETNCFNSHNVNTQMCRFVCVLVFSCIMREASLKSYGRLLVS